ncbi:folylpolyglutamate synthase [Zygosaccharomyces mellis]|uniref:Folylpolyglutamate synthase n=1 Tax=Zygosaccharomyces mellis TaxID=42258 RepID=A0A4C2DZ32_9SACH|nr:folylpolyglutamate synthase [Zygosaccharomyces mellis]
MGINLGLVRVVKLLSHLGNPHEKLRVLHVAGTNGKGSVCSYMGSVLGSKFRVGQFNSPHLIHITDCITVNYQSIPIDIYGRIRSELESLNIRLSLQCTEFEILTCVAFKYFYDSKVDWCILEVGLGGRLDATNVVPGELKHGCAITKIGLDHEAFLGTTIAEIAAEKAGIIVPGVKQTVLDGTNNKVALEEIKERCAQISCNLMVTSDKQDSRLINTHSWGILEPHIPLNGDYQIHNLRVAMAVLDQLQQDGAIDLDKKLVLNRLSKVQWPGRLHKVTVRGSEVLLDGAHNGCAALELTKYLRAKYGEQPLTLIIAVTNGKKLEPLLKPLIRPQDRVIVTKFGKVDGMPWIQPMD